MILLMMRSYFCIDLKGKSLFLPFLAAWAAAVGGTLLFLRFAERYASPEPLLDWSFAAFAVCCLAACELNKDLPRREIQP